MTVSITAKSMNVLMKIIRGGVIQKYRSAIVNELGHVMFWCDELQGDEQIGCILNGHPEWSIKCVESEDF